MTNAWWDRGERATSRRQVALRAVAAFAGIALTLSIWWPVGIGVAIVVCVAATVVANRMLEAGEDRGSDGVGDLGALLGGALDHEAVRF